MLCQTIYWTILINKFTAEIILFMCVILTLWRVGKILLPDSLSIYQW